MAKTRASIKLTLESLEDYLANEGRGLPQRLRKKVTDAVALLKARLYGKADCD